MSGKVVVHFRTMNELKRANAQIDADIISAVKTTAEPAISQEIAEATAEAINFVKDLFAGVRTFSTADLDAQPDELSRAVQNALVGAKIDPSQEYTKDTPIMFYNGVPFLTLQNFSQVIGLPKSRKSWFSQMIAGIFVGAQNGNQYDKNLTASKLQGTPSVLLIDTEQGNYRAAKMQKTITKIAGINQDIERFIKTFSLRKEGSDISLIATITQIIRQRPKLVIIDGIADLVTDPNDPKQSAIIYQFLLQASARYDCHIMVVIHANQSAINKDKAEPISRGRGHLGGDLERKSEANIWIEKPESNSDFTNVFFSSTRDITPDNFAFTIDGAGLPHPCDFVEVTSTQEKQVQKVVQVVQIMKSKQVAKWAHGDLWRALVGANSGAKQMSPRKAKDLIKSAYEAGLIEKTEQGRNTFYSIKAD